LIIIKRRHNLTQLRLSSRRLCIETGRWKKPNFTPLDKRKCIIFHTVEDEFHFVCECTMYDVIRKSFLPKYFWKRPNMFKFIELIKSDS